MLIFQKNILPDRPVDKQKVAENVEEWLQKQGIREEDEISMCELFDQYERKGREEGKQEGITTGRTEGRKEGLVEGIKCGEARRLVADIESAMQFFQVTLEKACEGLGTTVGGYEEPFMIIQAAGEYLKIWRKDQQENIFALQSFDREEERRNTG